MKFSLLLAVAVALFGSSEALKAPLGKLGQSRVSKAGAAVALPALVSSAPAWAKDAALSASPYGTGGEGTSDSLGINDDSLLWVLVAVSGTIFAAYVTNAKDLPNDDFFDGYDSTR